MDSEKLVVGSRVLISAIVTKIGKARDGNDAVLIEDVHVNGEYYKDHAWIKMSKRLQYPGGIDEPPLKVGDKIKSTAEVYEYLDGSSVSDMKIGFKTFRSVRIIGEYND